MHIKYTDVLNVNMILYEDQNQKTPTKTTCLAGNWHILQLLKVPHVKSQILYSDFLKAKQSSKEDEYQTYIHSAKILGITVAGSHDLAVKMHPQHHLYTHLVPHEQLNIIKTKLIIQKKITWTYFSVIGGTWSKRHHFITNISDNLFILALPIISFHGPYLRLSLSSIDKKSKLCKMLILPHTIAHIMLKINDTIKF